MRQSVNSRLGAKDERSSRLLWTPPLFNPSSDPTLDETRRHYRGAGVVDPGVWPTSPRIDHEPAAPVLIEFNGDKEVAPT